MAEISQTVWPGSTSQKFTTNRKHIDGPQPENKDHPLFSMGARKHFDAENSNEFKWKPSVKAFPDKDAPRVDRKSGVKILNPTFESMRARPERRHADNGNATTETFEDDLKGKCTFVQHNRKTVDEYHVEGRMQAKSRVPNMYHQRNGMDMTSLGDKVYKAPEYQTDFFREGGLIAGSTNQHHGKTSGNGKAIDFYSGLKLDGPVNKATKTYVQVVKEQTLAEEVNDVQSLKEWERSILKEVDSKYDPDDDSSDEEAIARKAAAKAQEEAKKAEEEPVKGKKK